MVDSGFKSKAGFTLIEIIAVLVVISIVSVIFAARLMDPKVDLIAAADVIKTHLRYAQSRAMSDNTIWGLTCSGNEYWLFTNGNTSAKRTLPGEKNDTIDITISEKEDPRWQFVASIEDFIISFDDWGIPHTDAAATDGNELTSGHAYSRITISYGGSSQTITITPNTGFIP